MGQTTNWKTRRSRHWSKPCKAMSADVAAARAAGLKFEDTFEFECLERTQDPTEADKLEANHIRALHAAEGDNYNTLRCGAPRLSKQFYYLANGGKRA